MKNFQEHPQSLILTDSIGLTLQQLHPDGQYCIGQDCGIYWRETDPPEKGAEAPDWFYVPSVPPKLEGEIRRSYVLWREFITPTIALEFASGDGSEERDSEALLRSADRTPLSRSPEGQLTKPGKFWVYEQVMRIPFYGIYEVKNGKLEAQQQRQRADQAEQRADQAEQQAEQERQKRQQLTEKLRSLTPDQLNALGITPADWE